MCPPRDSHSISYGLFPSTELGIFTVLFWRSCLKRMILSKHACAFLSLLQWENTSGKVPRFSQAWTLWLAECNFHCCGKTPRDKAAWGHLDLTQLAIPGYSHYYGETKAGPLSVISTAKGRDRINAHLHACLREFSILMQCKAQSTKWCKLRSWWGFLPQLAIKMIPIDTHVYRTTGSR